MYSENYMYKLPDGFLFIFNISQSLFSQMFKFINKLIIDFAIAESSNPG